MKTKLLLLISAMSLSVSATSTKNELVDTEVHAALAILEAKNDVENNHQYCRAKAGEYGYKYDYIKYIWELKNRPYIQVSETIFDGLPISSSIDVKQQWERSSDALLSTRSRADNNENGKYCSQYFSQLISGETQKVSASRTTLAPKLGSLEEIRIIERNIDMEVGCVKAGYNGNVKQFEDIKSACNCQTVLVVKKLSNREIDDFLALVAGNKAQDVAAFVEKRMAIPELQACYSNPRSE